MNDLNAVLRAVLANPASDDPRLMYADLLLERGDVRIKCHKCKGAKTVTERWRIAEMGADDYGTSQYGCPVCKASGEVLDTSNRARAEFIKVQIELAHLTEPIKCEKTFCDGSLVVCEECREWKRLNKREREIAAPGASHSWATLPGGFVPKLASGSTARNGTSGTFAFFRRGFVESLTCTAETFLEHEAALIWHPTQTDPCPEPMCKDGKIRLRTYERDEWGPSEYEEANCDVCLGKGRVPRPCPDTAQPITKVTLTGATNRGHTSRLELYRDIGQKIRSRKYPGTQFDLE